MAITYTLVPDLLYKGLPLYSQSGTVLVNPNVINDCSTYNTSAWSTFNTPAVTFGTTVADPTGAVTAQQVIFPASRAGVLQIFTPALAPGQYTASIYAKAVSVAPQQLSLAYYHNDFPQSQVSPPYVPTTTWQRFGPFTFTVAAGDQTPSIVIQNLPSNSTASIAAQTTAVWGLKVEAGTTMTDFNGSAPVLKPVANAMQNTVQSNILTSFAPNVTNTFKSLAITSNPSHGTAAVSSNNLTYQSAAAYAGADSFAYTATNSAGTSAPATVTMTVSAAPTVSSRLLGVWLFAYGPPTIATIQSVTPNYNYISYFAATGTGSGGTVNLGQVNAPSLTDVAAWKAAGKKIILDVGGQASNPGSSVACFLNNQSDQDQMYSSLVGLIDKYGFQGVGFDMETDSGQLVPSVMAGLIDRLKAHYGSSFIIEIDPAPYQIRDPSGLYANVYKLTPNNIDVIATQFYSQSGQSDDWFINSYILPGISGMVNNTGIPANKIVMGMADSGSGGAPSGATTYAKAMTQALLTFPTLRGAILWHAGAPTSSTFATLLKNAMP